jgi:hypothetical protein
LDGGGDELESFFFRGWERGKGHAVPEFGERSKWGDDFDWGETFHGVHL